MSFLQYLRSNRSLIVMAALGLLFVNLMMVLSLPAGQTAGNIFYTDAGCVLIGSGYLVHGYYGRRRFYRALRDWIGNGTEAEPELPDPGNPEQELVAELIRDQHLAQARKLQLLLDEKKEHQDYILSWIHEIKLPIAASRLLLENCGERSVEVLADKLEDEISRIDHYVEQALYQSRIDAFSKDYFITEVELKPLVLECVKKHAKLFIGKKIRVDLFEGNHEVLSDGKWLAYMIDQITVNALKYTGEGGEIAFAFEEDQAEKRLRIRDTGIGIKEEELRRIFDKGFTGTNGRTHAKSTGMGLYLAIRMAHRLGHDITAASGEGVFTELTVHFPKFRSYLQTE